MLNYESQAMENKRNTEAHFAKDESVFAVIYLRK